MQSQKSGNSPKLVKKSLSKTKQQKSQTTFQGIQKYFKFEFFKFDMNDPLNIFYNMVIIFFVIAMLYILVKFLIAIMWYVILIMFATLVIVAIWAIVKMARSDDKKKKKN